MKTKKITFPRSYKLTPIAINPLKGYIGLYLIYTDEIEIPYPFGQSRLIYIGKSDSKQYSIGGRLKDHISGVGNPAVFNYAQNYPVSFTYLNFEIVKSFWKKSIEELENYFINDFLKIFGCYPICNNRSSFEEIQPPTDIELDINWSFFSPLVVS
ncbi:MAG: hypothetical protein HWN69_00955 [Desulfobacterales bacterium]|nr:hypothetical protein [Desulfobacterales bacterium]